MQSKKMCSSVQSPGSALFKLVLDLLVESVDGWMAAPALNGVKDALGCDFWRGLLKLEHRKDTLENPRKAVRLLAPAAPEF